MSALHSLIVADNERPPRPAAAQPVAPGGPDYQPGHSARQTTGSVAVGRKSWWLATLSVAMTGDQAVLLTVERDRVHLAGPVMDQVTLVIPLGEVDAVLTLLQGIVAQARLDGVLGAAS